MKTFRSVLRVAIDDGHELSTFGKRTPPIDEMGGRVILENEFNKAVANKLEEILKRCGFHTLNVSSTDHDTLKERVDRANEFDADIFVSIHYNAYDGTFDEYDPEGVSVHILSKGGKAEELAKSVHKYLVQGTPQKDRGIVTNNFYVLRNTKMPAILTENGFMDNRREAVLMVDESFQKEVAIEHAKGICDFFKVAYVEESDSRYPKDLSIWAQPGYDFVIQNGISDGTNPKGIVTREQIWTMLSKMNSGSKCNEN